MDDPFDLARFVQAQDRVYGPVTGELRQGRKRSHWIWFIFPQVAGLGFSAMSERYAISGLTEARAYAAHPVLGPRLRECTQLVLNASPTSIREILGPPDDLKFRSSMTLFEQAVPDEPLFAQCVDKYFGGERDPQTLSFLSARG
jgi:uncharacterized protein (DUF1810 family)